MGIVHIWLAMTPLISASAVYAPVRGRIGNNFGMEESSASKRMRPDELEPVRIAMSFDRFSIDRRPRVDLRFLGSCHPLIYSLMFDTGSHVSVIVASPPADPSLGHSRPHSRRASKDERYISPVVDWTSKGECKLGFGVDSCWSEFNSLGCVDDHIVFMSSRDPYSLPISIHLIDRFDASMGVGLLGAAPTSHFAEFSRFFTYHPPRGPDRTPTLLVGERNEAVITAGCVFPELVWIPRDTAGSPNHWAIPGGMSVGDAAASIQSVNWIVDTGARRVFVTSEIFDYTVSTIESSGSAVGPYVPGYHTLVSNCTDYLTRFPVIHVHLGEELVVPIGPTEYVEWVGRGNVSTCALNMDTGRTADGSRLIGIQILHRLISAFDRDNDRVGFCILPQAVVH